MTGMQAGGAMTCTQSVANVVRGMNRLSIVSISVMSSKMPTNVERSCGLRKKFRNAAFT
jgi:hypothetical protein